MASAKVKVTFPDTALFNKGKRKDILNITIGSVDDITINTQRQVVKLAPVGVTSNLINQIGTKRTILKAAVAGEVNSGNVEYSIVVNDGRKKAYAPIAPLEQWVRLSSKGQRYLQALKSVNPKVTARQAAFMLSKSMSRKARKGQKFFDKGVINAESENLRIIEKMTDRIEDLL